MDNLFKLLTSRVVIFTGGYGSGKTEVAVNYALALKSSGKQVALVDLDIVNPYFRSREARQLLESAGVRVVAPRAMYSSSDVPALPPEIHHVLRSNDTFVVLDVGGDDVGARALGRFAGRIPADAQMLLVVNPVRPFQADVEALLSLTEKIEAASRISITGVVANTNLLHETTISLIEKHQPIIYETAKRLGLDVIFGTIEQQLLEEEGLPNVAAPLFPLQLKMNPPWRRFQ